MSTTKWEKFTHHRHEEDGDIEYNLKLIWIDKEVGFIIIVRSSNTKYVYRREKMTYSLLFDHSSWCCNMNYYQPPIPKHKIDYHLWRYKVVPWINRQLFYDKLVNQFIPDITEIILHYLF